VVLFISGGGWQQGNGEIDLSGFAAYENIVVFTFNYRTNGESTLGL
jgi:acetylcholinesterase